MPAFEKLSSKICIWLQRSYCSVFYKHSSITPLTMWWYFTKVYRCYHGSSILPDKDRPRWCLQHLWCLFLSDDYMYVRQHWGSYFCKCNNNLPFFLIFSILLPVYLFCVCCTLCCVYICMSTCLHYMSVFRQFCLKFFLSLIVPLSVYYYIYLLYIYHLLLYCDWLRPYQFIVSFLVCTTILKGNFDILKLQLGSGEAWTKEDSPVISQPWRDFFWLILLSLGAKLEFYSWKSKMAHYISTGALLFSSCIIWVIKWKVRAIWKDFQISLMV